MSGRTSGSSRDGTVNIIRNVLALLVSSAIMVAVGVPVMGYDYRSGTAALAGTVLLLVGLFAAVGITLALLDSLESVAAYLVATWRGLRAE